MEIKKRQHYVARYYLKPWSDNEQIYCIRNQKVFKSNLMNIAQEKYFYELQEWASRLTPPCSIYLITYYIILNI